MTRRLHIAPFIILVCIATSAWCQEEDEIAKYQPPRDYGHDWSFAPLLNYATYEGLLIGGGPRLYEFGFRKIPYLYRMDLVGGFTFKTGAYQFVYTAHFPSLLHKVDLEIYAHASQLEVLNFYGFGNSSVRNKKQEDVKFYSVNSNEYILHPSLKYRPNKVVSLGFETLVEHFQLRQRGIRFLTVAQADKIGNDKTIVGAGLSFGVDSRNHPLFPSRGLYVRLEGWNHADAFSRSHPFQRIAGDLRFFFGDTLLRDFVVGVHVRGEKLHGKFPFHEAAFLGGPQSLRGYRLQRFAGDAAVLGSVDLRISMFRLKVLVPTEVGILLLADAGRVWYEGHSSGDWHTDTGGGFWFAPLSRDLTISVLAASSVDGLVINAGFGFSY